MARTCQRDGCARGLWPASPLCQSSDCLSGILLKIRGKEQRGGDESSKRIMGDMEMERTEGTQSNGGRTGGREE